MSEDRARNIFVAVANVMRSRPGVDAQALGARVGIGGMRTQTFQINGASRTGLLGVMRRPDGSAVRVLIHPAIRGGYVEVRPRGQG
jgi:hypothetical protein